MGLPNAEGFLRTQTLSCCVVHSWGDAGVHPLPTPFLWQRGGRVGIWEEELVPEALENVGNASAQAPLSAVGHGAEQGEGGCLAPLWGLVPLPEPVPV